MLSNFREFEAGPDPFGDKWLVQLGWLQTAIAIRHSDSVDVKFFLSKGQERQEKVVVLAHTDLVALSKELGRPITDPWCIKLAALHLAYVIETGEDLEKSLLVVQPTQLQGYAAMLEQPAVPRG